MSLLSDAELEALRTRYRQERPIYEAMSAVVSEQLGAAATRRGLEFQCKGRAKEVDSFVKKALAKRDKYQDPYADIHDKAGVRLILAYLNELPVARDLVETTFEVVDEIDKTGQLGSDRLGYRGFHFEVQLRGNTMTSIGGQDVDLSGLLCEVQLQTRAQNLWNDMEHDLVYKPVSDPPPQIKRSILRLVVLMELYDDEVVRARKELAELPMAESELIYRQLERHFFTLTARCDVNRELSFEILEVIRELLDDSEKGRIRELLDQFVSQRSEQLSTMYKEHFRVEDANPLIFQPETILILNRLEHDHYALKDLWGAHLPLSLLEELADIWGVPL